MNWFSYGCSFLSLEALLLVSIKNCNHWSGPIFWTYTEHYFVSYSQSIRFVRLDSEHEQSDRKSVNCRPPVLDLPSSCDSWCWPKGARPLGTRMMIIMASSIACGYICTMTVMAATTELCKMVGHSLDNRLTETCSLGIQPTALILDIHVMAIDTCQKVYADQYHMTISQAQIKSSSRSCIFEVDRSPGAGCLIGSQANVNNNNNNNNNNNKNN